MTVCDICQHLTEGLGPYCMDCKREIEQLEIGVNPQCQKCGGYEYDDGTCELCYCYEENINE